MNLKSLHGCRCQNRTEVNNEYTGKEDKTVIQNSKIWQQIKDLPSAEPVKHEECEYVITKGKAGYHEEYKCSVCGDSFYWTHDKMFPNKFNYCRNCGRKIVKFIDESKG